MKKTIFAILPVFGLLVFATVFNVVKYEKSKISWCEVSRTCLGIDLEKTGEGENRAIFILHSKGSCTVGNTKKIIFTWHMN